GWEPVRLRKGRSTFQILESIRKILCGRMNKMVRQSIWLLARRRLKQERLGLKIM
ncbi:hypothetical protein MKW94_014836, partial [Papaver nudicaule]|nr:hypothetical protein [Papaver nudicaule]